jgi:transposase
VDAVATLDLSAIYVPYEAKDGRGQATYSPEMMLRVLLYGYSTRGQSSRKIETRTYVDVAFRHPSVDDHPDQDTIAEFRKRHLDALAGLFRSVLGPLETLGSSRAYGRSVSLALLTMPARWLGRC